MTLQHAKAMATFINTRLTIARTHLANAKDHVVNPQWIIDADKTASGKAVSKKQKAQPIKQQP